jgi:hypothetical protein
MRKKTVFRLAAYCKVYSGSKEQNFSVENATIGGECCHSVENAATRWRMPPSVENANIRWRMPPLGGECCHSVENAAILLEDEVRRSDKRTIVVFQIFDNNVYLAAQPDGSRSLPVRSKSDGTYHVPGRLELADHNLIKNLVKSEKFKNQ